MSRYSGRVDKLFYLAGVLLALTFFGFNANGGEKMGFRIKSPDFTEGHSIPKKFTCDGEDLSPEVSWEDAPAGTKSFALIVEDPDAPMGTFTHWVVYDLPASTRKLNRGDGNKAVSEGGLKNGHTDFGRMGYGGPCPPKGHGRHRYYFKLIALDVDTLGLPSGASKNEVLMAMKDHVLAEATTMGVYQR